MRKRFDLELEQLKDKVVEMGTKNDLSLELVLQLFQACPDQREQIKNQIKTYEVQVDDLERQIQTRALRLLISQQPVARDLRTISAALNIITDMERISDQAYDIAETAMFLGEINPSDIPDPLVQMIRCCMGMTRQSVEAFTQQDLQIAQQVMDADDAVDQLFLTVRDRIIDQINRDKESGEQAIDLMIIAKYLERIADHAVNIAEWVVFNINWQNKDKYLI